MPVPPSSDLLATISMFEQQIIKSEPMGFYSTCPPPPPQMAQPIPRSENSDQGVITIHQDDKDMQPQSLIVVRNLIHLIKRIY